MMGSDYGALVRVVTDDFETLATTLMDELETSFPV